MAECYWSFGGGGLNPSVRMKSIRCPVCKDFGFESMKSASPLSYCAINKQLRHCWLVGHM